MEIRRDVAMGPRRKRLAYSFPRKGRMNRETDEAEGLRTKAEEEEGVPI